MGAGVACVLLAASAFAGEQWGEIRRPSGGQALRAGEWVEVEWTALPPEVEEFELLLSLDDGASFAVRLTPQLNPAISSFRWRVPNFPTSRARIQLRVGIDHREIERPPGEAFEIAGEAARPLAGLRWHEGEWWATSHTWPAPPLERLPSRFTMTPPATPEVVGALSFQDPTADLDAAVRAFQAPSPMRRTVRAAPPVTDHTPINIPQRE
jgi:hypothetical protein